MSTYNVAPDATSHMKSKRIALTGAAGSLATDIIPALLQTGYELACIDQARPAEDFGQDWFECSINDREALAKALEGCGAVIHLAGIPLEDDWASIMTVNIDGTESVLQTARSMSIQKVVLASSIHAAGNVRVPASGMVPDDVEIRPNTYYGVSKAALEALGSYYHDRFGMDVICLRIASRFERPRNVRMLSTWLSPSDAGRLFLAALGEEAKGFHRIWGVSRNSRGYLSHDGGQAIGYFPQDDAEQFAAQIEAAALTDQSAMETEWDRTYIGGIFSSPSPPMQPTSEASPSSPSTARNK
jgi:uronate dehydrogenase